MRELDVDAAAVLELDAGGHGAVPELLRDACNARALEARHNISEARRARACWAKPEVRVPLARRVDEAGERRGREPHDVNEFVEHEEHGCVGSRDIDVLRRDVDVAGNRATQLVCEALNTIGLDVGERGATGDKDNQIGVRRRGREIRRRNGCSAKGLRAACGEGGRKLNPGRGCDHIDVLRDDCTRKHEGSFEFGGFGRGENHVRGARACATSAHSRPACDGRLSLRANCESGARRVTDARSLIIIEKRCVEFDANTSRAKSTRLGGGARR
eukprot:Amastigsp_a339539_451.p2 type:complete len:272 gc:universal Amastigsp_a339539_451:796-1611(+)